MDHDIQRMIAGWMETDREARLIVGEDLRPQWVSPAAERILSDPNSVLYTNGRLRPRSPKLDNELRSFVSEVTEAPTTHCLTDSRTGEHVVLTMTRLRGAVAITLHLAENDSRVRLVDLHQAFGLTDAERAVAEHLLNGTTADETASLLGVSLETVRTHIKRAYAKLGVSSREAFFNKLRPFVVRLD